MELTKHYLGDKIKNRSAGYVHIWGRDEEYTGVYGRNLRERDHLEDPLIDGRIILKLIFKKSVQTWTGLIWFRMGTGGGI